MCSSCKLKTIAEVSLRYKVELICLSLIAVGPLKLRSELVSSFLWSCMSKSRSWTWVEPVFEEVVDKSDKNWFLTII